ncbi:DUF3558 family protein [Rhodococcus sp. NPDC058521]|uniref:DUF3558 family protein n=1 Tax=Rhodococcus sp. NPDC058521 TaxID=3346536 RepID=UPI003656F7BB
MAMRKAMGLGALIAASALLVGCGAADSVEQTAAPAADGANKNPGLFEPCDIPDVALEAAGLDPATEDADFFGVQATGWELCTWEAGWYYLAVLSTTHSFDEVKSNPNNLELTAVDSIPGRDAVTYRDKSDVNRETCDAAFPFEGGTLIVRSDKKGTELAQELPCVMAVRGAVALNDVLPM